MKCTVFLEIHTNIAALQSSKGVQIRQNLRVKCCVIIFKHKAFSRIFIRNLYFSKLKSNKECLHNSTNTVYDVNIHHRKIFIVNHFFFFFAEYLTNELHAMYYVPRKDSRAKYNR